MLKWPGSTLTRRRRLAPVASQNSSNCAAGSSAIVSQRTRCPGAGGTAILNKKSVCCRTSYSSSQSMLKDFTCHSVLTQLHRAAGARCPQRLVPQVLGQVLEQVGEVIGVLFLRRRNLLQHRARGRIERREITDHLAIAVDGDPLRDEILLDHVDQRIPLDVLGVATRRKAIGGEIRCAAELDDALRNTVGVFLLLAGVLEKLRGDRSRMNASRHEVMALVAQHANDLGRQRGVEDLDRRFGVAAVAIGHSAAGDVLPRPLAQRLDVGQEWLLLRVLCVAHGWFPGHVPSPRRFMYRYIMRYASAPRAKASRIRAGEAE